ncbi:unnamed protein product [Mytilus coruscus]|uniref:WSC domain-containing protein n=1 Tax=Mytilus coruscus TaxID=42192 RepID=A0A6J8D189_MYTCO|nr:unnamed protein product [Mytilus coruscus]
METAGDNVKSKTSGPNCAVLYECYNDDSPLWDPLFENDAVTNNVCENKCKANGSNYQYSGTFSKKCFCRKKDLVWIDRTSMLAQCTENIQCPGDNSECCGGNYTIHTVTYKRMTVSKIDQHRNTVTAKVTQTTCVTHMAVGEPITTNFVELINTATSPVTVTKSTPLNTRISTSMTSENTQTSISTEMTHATTDIELSTAKRMRPRKLLCKCPKRLINTKWHFLDGKNITDAKVKELVLEDFNKNIKSEISVDKKTVSKEVRKKNSSVNKRKSSQSIGWGCIVFLILPMGVLIAIDILNCSIHVRTRCGRRKRNRIRTISNIQDQRDSVNPPQENVDIDEEFYASRCGNNFHPDEMKRKTYQRRRDDNKQQSRDEWLQYI